MICKETFVKSINKIKECWDYDAALNNVFRQFNNDSTYINMTCEDALINVLNEAMGLPVDCDDIGYFCYELKFGKEYRPGDIIDEEGNEIDFSTAEKLYDYLVTLQN